MFKYFEYADKFKKMVNSNEDFQNCEFIKTLKNNLHNISEDIEKGHTFFRARTYEDPFDDLVESLLYSNDNEETRKNKMDKFNSAVSEQKNTPFKGYDKLNSFVNLNKDKISENRCNKETEICLYCANNIETAISEIKPPIRSKVSIAEIITKEPLKIINFKIDKKHYEWTEPILKMFSDSKTCNSPNVYKYTQIICDIVKENGYDGVAFSSSQNLQGVCYAIFNYYKCEAASSQINYIDKINYSFHIGRV